jgi:hypothetical protein
MVIDDDDDSNDEIVVALQCSSLAMLIWNDDDSGWNWPMNEMTSSK